MTTELNIRNADRMTAAQLETVRRMMNAPALKWVHTKTLQATVVGGLVVKGRGVAVQLEAPSAKIWGLVLPDGSFQKPKPGRKSIDSVDVVFKL